MRAIVLTGVFVTALAAAAYAADGVIEINQARAMAGGVTPSDTPGFPVTINQPGSYRLTGNLTPGASAHGITVAANNVTIDLNGFAIISPSVGIMAAGYTNFTVANGSVLLATQIGIFLGEVGRVERVRVTGNIAETLGILAQQGAVVSGCSVSGAKIGISINSGVVTGNIITHNERGVVTTTALITGNVIEENSSWGLDLGNYVGYSGNTLRDNHGAVGNPNVRGGGTSLGANLCDNTLCP